MKFIDLSELERDRLKILCIDAIPFRFDAGSMKLHENGLNQLSNLTKIEVDILNRFLLQQISISGGSEGTCDNIENNPENFFNCLFDFDSEIKQAVEYSDFEELFEFLNTKARFDDEFLHPLDYVNMGFLTINQLKERGSCYVCQRFHKNESVQGVCLADKKETYRTEAVRLDCHQFKGLNINVKD
jgi:hypothetical protein